ncbi:MAG TPA: DUF349 domain-containing protein [Bacteroidia bacterium]|nr:DUF349 domain-containing protein [Bacteroidia bacterium]HNT80505.1 DUF349 domain-containing protein [Bacteroidia bacterium]
MDSEKETNSDNELKIDQEKINATNDVQKSSVNDDFETHTEADDESDISEIELDYDEEQSKEENEEEQAEDSNYLVYNRSDLVEKLSELASSEDIIGVRKKVNAIREAFVTISDKEKSDALENFLDEGGLQDDFVIEEDEISKSFYSLLEKFNRNKVKYFKQLDKERGQNYHQKHEILLQLKNLIQHEEDVSKAFNEFHELQAKWRSIGPVPHRKSEDLWMTYKHYIDSFYEFIRLNRQLQELDWKRNFEIKIQLCEQAESLLLEPSIGIALKQIQTLKNQWHDVGQVPRESRSELGSRFKAAIDKVIDRKKHLSEENKQQQLDSKKLKEELCEKIESILKNELNENVSWQKKITEVIELQGEWKKAGYAGKDANDLLWDRFKNGCDAFFAKKSEQNKKRRAELQKNLQAKTELTIQAEALKESTDWKIATEEFIKLQKQWKKIGYAGEKSGNQIWDRFKSAGDYFFEAKKNFFSNIDQEYEKNLESKIALLTKIENFSSDEGAEAALEQIKAFQREWLSIGLVPIKEKDKIQKKYHQAINKQFSALGIADQRKTKIMYKERINHIKESDGMSQRKFSAEKQQLKKKLSELNSDVQLWENNLGFFAKSKNAESIKAEFETKISAAKKEMDVIKEKLEMLKTTLSADK